MPFLYAVPPSFVRQCESRSPSIQNENSEDGQRCLLAACRHGCCCRFHIRQKIEPKTDAIMKSEWDWYLRKVGRIDETHNKSACVPSADGDRSSVAHIAKSFLVHRIIYCSIRARHPNDGRLLPGNFNWFNVNSCRRLKADGTRHEISSNSLRDSDCRYNHGFLFLIRASPQVVRAQSQHKDIPAIIELCWGRQVTSMGFPTHCKSKKKTRPFPFVRDLFIHFHSISVMKHARHEHQYALRLNGNEVKLLVLPLATHA